MPDLIHSSLDAWFFALALCLFFSIAVGGRRTLQVIFFKQRAVMEMSSMIAGVVRGLAIFGSVELIAMLVWHWLSAGHQQ